LLPLNLSRHRPWRSTRQILPRAVRVTRSAGGPPSFEVRLPAELLTLTPEALRQHPGFAALSNNIPPGSRVTLVPYVHRDGAPEPEGVFIWRPS
jgi:hypothetical protein